MDRRIVLTDKTGYYRKQFAGFDYAKAGEASQLRFLDIPLFTKLGYRWALFSNSIKNTNL